MHATTIQRYMRGYRVSQQLIVNIRMDKLRQNFGFFKEMRDDLVESSVVKIQNYVRKVFLPSIYEKKHLKNKGKKKKKNTAKRVTGAKQSNVKVSAVVGRMQQFAGVAKVAP